MLSDPAVPEHGRAGGRAGAAAAARADGSAAGVGAASGERQRRRRGAALEAALLDAVWDEVAENGYAELTYEAVAARAGTSRSVVYRRWPTKPELVLAAIAHRGAGTALPVPDTGTLRGDLLALLRSFNTHRADTMVLFGTQMGPFYRDTGISPSAARRSWVGDREGGLSRILEHAVARGEVDPARATPRAATAALDLLRHDVLMRMGRVSDARIVEIVDQVAVPLLTGRVPEPPPAG